MAQCAGYDGPKSSTLPGIGVVPRHKTPSQSNTNESYRSARLMVPTLEKRGGEEESLLSANANSNT